MKTTFFNLLAVFFFGAQSLFAQNAYSENVADAVYDEILHEYTLNADRSTNYQYQHKLRLKTSFAFTRQYGESFIVYNPQVQKLDVIQSETAMADGKKVPSPVNAYNEVLPAFAGSSPPYMHLREMVVTHPGLEKNAVIHFHYRIDTKKGYYPGLTGKIIMGGRSPIKKMTVKIQAPSGIRLKYGFTGAPSEPVISKAGKMTVYTWTFSEIPLIAVEQGQPPLDHFTPTLYFSTIETKDAVKHIIPDEKKLYAIPGTIKDQVQALVKDKTELKDKALALSDFVRKSAGAMTADLHFLGYRAMPAERTFRENTGSQLDKAVLLAALFRAAGMEADPALVSDIPGIQNDLAFLPLFNQVLVRVKGFDGWIDPVNPQNEAIPAAYFGKSCMILKSKPESVVINPPSKESRFTVTGELKIDDNFNITGKGSVETDGIYRFDMNPAGIGGLIRGFFAGSSLGMTIDDKSAELATGKTNRWNGEFKGTLTKDVSGQFLGLTLPKGLREITTLPLQDTPRLTPVLLTHPVFESQEWKIQLPGQVNFNTKPLDISVSNEIGDLKISIKENDKQLIIRRNVVLKNENVNAGNFRQLLEFITIWKDPANLNIVLNLQN